MWNLHSNIRYLIKEETLDIRVKVLRKLCYAVTTIPESIMELGL